jgi:hypothetical protein
MPKIFYHVYNSDYGFHAIYDETRSKIKEWEGEYETYYIIQDILSLVDIDLFRDTSPFDINNDFGKKFADKI